MTCSLEEERTIEDTAKVLSRYIHGVVIRTYSHSDVVEFAKNAHFPVINALTDEFHPCQILTDLFTINEFSGKMKDVKVAYLGDCASNMANSIILAAKLAGLDLVLASPEKYKPHEELMQEGNLENGNVSWTTDVYEAVKDAEYIYTDVWVSMGDEKEKEERLELLNPYQVNMDVVDAASEGVRIMHCLPAHRGEEISGEVLESHKSIVFDQAENRLHVQKAIPDHAPGRKLGEDTGRGLRHGARGRNASRCSLRDYRMQDSGYMIFARCDFYYNQNLLSGLKINRQ